MNKPEHHFLVCASFRAGGDAKGFCSKKGVQDLVQYLQEEIADRGIDGMVTTTGCMNLCQQGPIMTVYPSGDWYGAVNEEKIDTILDAIESGSTAEALLIEELTGN